MWTHVYVPIVQDLYNWFTVWHSQHEKCPHSVFFWSVFSRIPTEYWEIRSISPYSVRMQENMDQKNSEYGHFSRRIKLRESVLMSF